MNSTLKSAEHQTRTIVAFYGACGTIVFGNFFPRQFIYDGIIYLTAEGAFQAQKDPSQRHRFVNLTGEEAFKLGRQVTPCSNWHNIKRNIMLNILIAKFSDPQLKELLRLTGNAYIVEHCERKGRDSFWSDDYDGSGQNELGKILMEIRQIFFGVPIPSCPQEYWQKIANKSISGDLCKKCNTNKQNPGRSWCQPCYLQSIGQSSVQLTGNCTNCQFRQANPGRKWCEICFQQKNLPQPNSQTLYVQQKVCTNCLCSAANPGYDWCQTCFNKKQSIGQQLSSHTVYKSQTLCKQCHNCQANPGFSLCQGCFLQQRNPQNLYVQQTVCKNCRCSAANQGFDLCQGCFNQHRNTRNGYIVQQSFTQMATQQTKTCTKCHFRVANPGRAWCQPCFLS